MDKDLHNTLEQLGEIEKMLNEAKQRQEQQGLFKLESAKRFEKNLVVLKQYFPDLHKQVVEFTPSDDFHVFASRSGYGNFVPRGVEVPIYGDDPLEQSRQQVKRYTEKAHFARCQLYKEADPGTKSDKRLHMRYMVKLAESFSDAVADDVQLLKQLPEHFPTCIMFGVGLGYALSILLETHSFDYIFVCEPDFETFYASLFCTDWEEILNKADAQSGCVFLQIGVTYERFFTDLQGIYENIGAFSLISSFCYQHTPGTHVNALISEFFERFYQIQLGYGFYNDAVTGLAHTVENFNDNQCPVFIPPKANHSPYKNLTAYVVANGPSVDEAVEALKENQDNVIIFAAGTAINTLLRLGVKPDFHVLVERPKITYDVLLETLELGIMRDMNLLAVDVMYPEVPNLYKWCGLGLKGPEAGTLLMQYEFFKKYHQILPALPCAAPLVANTALSFASMMGFGEIYLFGVDNGYPEVGPSHSTHSIYSDKKFNDKYKVSTDAPYRMKGNLGGHVKATSLMVQAKLQMERLISDSNHIEFYNVGSGASIAKATPLEADDILCMPLSADKKVIVEEIKSRFFTPFPLDKSQELVGIDEFESLCDYMIEIGKRPFSNRKEASDLLKAQSRVVYAYRGQKYGHLFHVMKGTMLYFHCPLMSLLYLYSDEEKTLAWFKDSMAVWNDCVEAMKADYRNSWNQRCDFSLEVVREQKRLTDEYLKK